MDLGEWYYRHVDSEAKHANALSYGYLVSGVVACTETCRRIIKENGHKII